jgi:hypothetical protein
MYALFVTCFPQTVLMIYHSILVVHRLSSGKADWLAVLAMLALKVFRCLVGSPPSISEPQLPFLSAFPSITKVLVRFLSLILFNLPSMISDFCYAPERQCSLSFHVCSSSIHSVSVHSLKRKQKENNAPSFSSSLHLLLTATLICNV